MNMMAELYATLIILIFKTHLLCFRWLLYLNVR